ncbi:MAG: type VI secretion system ImpA family N-terminal domain-containing protein, partial [Candidatus Thiodiazotropha sp.]
AEGKEEQQFGVIIIPAEDPDWRELKKKSLEVASKSRDQRAAVYLTQALIRTDGFDGLTDGLALIKGYLDNYWESVHPQLDPDDANDPTLRINTLINICAPFDSLAGINKIPVVSSTVMGKFSYRDIQLANGNLQKTDSDPQDLSLDQIDAAFREASDEDTGSQQLGRFIERDCRRSFTALWAEHLCRGIRACSSGIQPSGTAPNCRARRDQQS